MGAHKLSYNEVIKAFELLSEEEQARLINRFSTEHKDDPIYSFGKNPVSDKSPVTDASEKLDNYLYSSL